MARPGLMPSLLDRLTDPESLAGAGARGYSPHQMLEAVRRDLEDLFNTHQSDTGVAEGYEEVRRSVVTFGLPDLPSIAERTGGDPEAVRRILLDAIGRFEPRLREVRVTVLEDAAHGNRRLALRIEGRLNVDPSPDVVFETELELSTGQAKIRSS